MTITEIIIFATCLITIAAGIALLMRKSAAPLAYETDDTVARLALAIQRAHALNDAYERENVRLRAENAALRRQHLHVVRHEPGAAS